MAIGDADYQASFPFVEQIDLRPVKAIKPLHLAQGQPSKIMEHGAAWLALGLSGSRDYSGMAM